MQFLEVKHILIHISSTLRYSNSFESAIEDELTSVLRDPSIELEEIHQKLKDANLNDKIVKYALNTSGDQLKQLYGYSAVLDYYLIFLGFKIPLGGVDWLNNDEDLLLWYKKKIHNTNYGRIAIRHKFDSIYTFKVLVAEACQRWLFSKWRFFSEELKNNDVIIIREQISSVKNARLIIDTNTLKKIFEFNSKDFFYDKNVIDFLSGYNFEIEQFENHLKDNISTFGCDYRKRLDNCYELIFA
jgi:hypothetical protein